MAERTPCKAEAVGSSPTSGSMQTVRIGDLTVLKVAAALAARQERILFPFSQQERYDLALDRNGVLYRIQCKSGKYNKGSVVFNACSSEMHHGGKRRPYVGQIEAFGVFCADLDTVYLIPIEQMKAQTRCRLRVEPAKNNQQAGTLEAAGFII